MKKLYLLICMISCALSLSAQHHRTKVPELAQYDQSVGIEDNMNRLLNEVVSLDFSECTSSTISSIETKDTIWIRNVKNPLNVKYGRDFKLSSRNARIEDFYGKEFLVKSIERKVEGEYYRTFYSVLTLVNVKNTNDIYTWTVQTSSNHNKSMSNDKIRIYSKRWSQIVDKYISDGKSYYYESSIYAKPNKDNGYTKYVKIHYDECDFFLGGDYFTGRYISKYKDAEGRVYVFDEYTMRESEFPISEEKYNQIVASSIARLKSAGKYYYTLSKVIKPANKTIRYGKTEERKTDDIFSQYFYEDNIISILIMGRTKQFEFTLTNKLTNSIKIVWDAASFVDENNFVSKVVHEGVKYIEANNEQPATTIPGGASISELVAPTNRITYSYGWYQEPIVSSKKSNDPNIVGKTIKVLLPIEVNGIVNEYVFCFTIGWEFTYPEYQE